MAKTTLFLREIMLLPGRLQFLHLPESPKELLNTCQGENSVTGKDHQESGILLLMLT